MRVASLLARSLAVGLALSLTTGCVAGTKDDAPAESGSMEIEFWTINLKKNFESYIGGLIDGFEKEHPGARVTWVDVPGKEIKPKLLAAVASGKVPDVVNLSNLDLEGFVPSLTDLGPHVTVEQQQAYTPNLLEPLKADGKLVALPWYNGGAPVFMYNSELVRKAGLDVDKPPRTYTEALQWGIRLHQATPGVYGMNGLPMVAVLQSEGMPVLSPDGRKAAFNTPEVKALLSTWKDAYDKGGIAPGTIGKDDRSLPQTIENQQIAFSASILPFTLTNIQKNAPGVYRAIRLAPAVTGQTGAHILSDQQTLVVPKGADNPKLAAAFASYVTSAENQTAFCKLVAIYPSTLESLKDPHFSTFQPGDLGDQARKIVAEELPAVKLGFLGTGADDKLNERWMENMRAMFSGAKTVDQAVADAEREWNAILAAK
ncbi:MULTISPECIES: extracellular solute-binding protein [unclassified Micromonospora]|uniref:ABC transporter substrate-binding protein n=1 Tax=unclassified Micromonospora TaxID=2617518 RepID=UPI00332B8A03